MEVLDYLSTSGEYSHHQEAQRSTADAPTPPRRDRSVKLSKKRMLGGIAVLSDRSTPPRRLCRLRRRRLSGDDGDSDTSPSRPGRARREETAVQGRSSSSSRREHDGAKVKLNVVPYDQMFSNIDAQLAVRRRARRLPRRLRQPRRRTRARTSCSTSRRTSRDDEIDAFVPAHVGGRLVRRQALRRPAPDRHLGAARQHRRCSTAAGITDDVPDHSGRRLDLGGVRRRRDQAARRAPRRQVPVRLQLAAGRRAPLAELALPGRRHAARARTARRAAIDSAEGTKALDFTKSFFENKWVPPTSSIKATRLRRQPLHRADGGDGLRRLLPGARTWTRCNKFDWTAIPMPRDERGATDLGGNALVATKDDQEPRARRGVPNSWSRPTR